MTEMLSAFIGQQWGWRSKGLQVITKHGIIRLPVGSANDKVTQPVQVAVFNLTHRERIEAFPPTSFNTGYTEPS